MAVPLSRVTQLLFGSTGPTGDFGVFGSKAAGTPVFSQDPTQIQSLPAFLDGWGESIIGDYDPPLEDMNSLFLLAFRQIAYIFQQGIAEYDPNINYFVGSIVMVGGLLYNSQTNSNQGNYPPTDPGTNWLPGIGGGNGGVPTGTILPWGGASTNIPPGFLYGDGRAVSRSTYANLFNYYGTMYGAGNGTTTFNLPNGQGNVLVGMLPSDGSFGTIGATGGEKTHTLVIAEVPSLTITIPAAIANGSGQFEIQGTNNGASPSNFNFNTNGGGGAHNNLQPYQVIGGVIVKF